VHKGVNPEVRWMMHTPTMRSLFSFCLQSWIVVVACPQNADSTSARTRHDIQYRLHHSI
jgi:hypothetical protein